VESVMRERQSSATFWLTAVFTVVIFVVAVLVWQYRDPDVTLALVPTVSPIPPTASHTPTMTPLPTDTRPPTQTPTITPTPAPTDTPRPSRFHTVTSGETMFGLSLRFRVSAESIAQANDLPLESGIQAGQQLVIPWPTATPPLESVALEINGETVIADASDCDIYEIQPGDSAYALSVDRGVPLEAIIAVNRHTQESIQLLQPGDTLCIPEVIYGGTLPPTAGPSPTPSPTLLPEGPALLYPVRDAVIDPPDGVVTLQWAAVKNLAQEEWYMVEVSDLDEIDSLPHRGFTRDTSFQLPSSWRPTEADTHQMRWRVSIVQVTDWRSDGQPIYTYGGESSENAFFSWLGAVPTPTPTATATRMPDS
jgi:LysM repeat protein